MHAGLDGLRSECGAFSVLSREALRPEPYVPDFGALLGTCKVRLLVIERELFAKARLLDQDREALEFELDQLRLPTDGDESPRRELC